ncbi:hypothetical protein BS78_02G054500 [Paspalum vaginatum]|nr:hypothetical protein BS78_02G054500 [Paspalum vaginatum]
MGMPCCHAVKVMMHLGMQEIPPGNIVKHWTRNARDISPDDPTGLPKDMTPGMPQAHRYSALYDAAIELVDLGASTDEAFSIATSALAQAKQKLLEAGDGTDGAGSAKQSSHAAAAPLGSETQDMPAMTTDGSALAAGSLRLGKKLGLGRKRKLLSILPAE